MVKLTLKLVMVYTTLLLVSAAQSRVTSRFDTLLLSSQAPTFQMASPAPAPVKSPPDGGRSQPSEKVFDVTDYGAVADGKNDSSQAFLWAWEEACKYEGNSTLLVPGGTFFLEPVEFTGPCASGWSPKVEIQGTLQAPTSLKDRDEVVAWILFRNLHGLELTGGAEMGTLDDQGAETWRSDEKHSFRMLKFIDVSSGKMSKIALKNGKNFHLSFEGCDNIDVHDIDISAPWDSPNTDGIHTSNSRNISITSSVIGVGDDCVSIAPGSTGISVLNVTCGPGHGISVGSLGNYDDEEDVSGITVKNCTIKDTQNGVRIKTWPNSPTSSKAYDMIFKDIVVVNVSNPIIVNQEYCPHNSCDKSEPSNVKLSDITFENISGTSNTKPAVTLIISSIVPCENMQLVNVNLNYTGDATESKKPPENIKGPADGIKIIGSHF